MQEDSVFVPKERGQNLIIESAVSYYGTINQHKNGSYYIVEIRIPFLSIGMKPYEGQVIKIDVCNNDSDFLLSELPVTKEELYYTWPFSWSGFGNSNMQSPDYLYGNVLVTTSYQVLLIVENSFDCSDTIVETAVVYPLLISQLTQHVWEM